MARLTRSLHWGLVSSDGAAWAWGQSTTRWPSIHNHTIITMVVITTGVSVVGSQLIIGVANQAHCVAHFAANAGWSEPPSWFDPTSRILKSRNTDSFANIVGRFPVIAFSEIHSCSRVGPSLANASTRIGPGGLVNCFERVWAIQHYRFWLLSPAICSIRGCWRANYHGASTLGFQGTCRWSLKHPSVEIERCSAFSSLFCGWHLMITTIACPVNIVTFAKLTFLHLVMNVPAGLPTLFMCISVIEKKQWIVDGGWWLAMVYNPLYYR